MKSEPSGPAARRLITMIASVLVLITSANVLATDACDCGCSRYAQLLVATATGLSAPDTFVERCGGACAIAWTRCEALNEYDVSQMPVVIDSEPESELAPDARPSEPVDDDRPVVRSDERYQHLP